MGDGAPLAVESFELRELFDELAMASRPTIEAKGLRLSTRCDTDVTTVLSNRIKVKQVALNLLSNATKYSKSGEFELVMGGHGEGGWYLRVADTGVGIALSDTDRIFDEFERAAGEDIPGVGLGLAIVKELCGFLTARFETREGHGTTFAVRFSGQSGTSQDLRF